MSWADVFVSAFVTSGNFRGLTTSLGVGAEQAKLAFYGIDATRIEVEAGRLTASEGESIIDGHKNVIRNFLHDVETDAIILASSGEASKLPALEAMVRQLLYVARQDALLGREDPAVDAQRALGRVLVAFSERFAATCDQQTFPVEIALTIERQNLILGTGAVSVMDCARRVVTADISRQGVNYHFENCFLNHDDDWKLTITGRVTGKGTGETDTEEGRWESETSYRGRQDFPVGRLQPFTAAVVVVQAPPLVPDDTGPGARPNGLPKAPLPAIPPPLVQKVKKLRMTTIELTGERGFNGWTSNLDTWAEAPIVVSDQPCKRR